MLDYRSELEEGRQFNGKLPFKPIIIQKKVGHISKSPNRKVLMKTIGQNKPKNQSLKRFQNPKLQKDWYQGGKLTGLFDDKLKKNQLSTDYLRNKKKSVNIQNKQQTIKQIQKNRLTGTQRNIHNKSHKQVQHLKLLIQKEKQQKRKNDLLFQQQQKKLQKQRKQLKVLADQIKKMGPTKTKIKAETIKQINNDIPTHDKCKIQYKPLNSNYPEITQTEEIIKQRNEIRQKQLQKLMGKKQRLQNYNNALNYTPTLIPLLSRASYKIVSTHISTLTELLVDELLLQQILVLEQIEEKEQNKRKLRKQKQMITDYMQLVEQLARENDQIQYKVNKHDKFEFGKFIKRDLYKPFQQQRIYRHINQQDAIYLVTDQNLKKNTQKNKIKFYNFCKYRDQYDNNNFKMFAQATQQIIQQLLTRMVQQLDKGSGQFVQIVFKNQFK